MRAARVFLRRRRRARMRSARVSVVALVLVIVVAAAVGDAAAAATVRVAFVAAALLAVVAAMPAAARVPDGVGQEVHALDRRRGIVAGYDELASPRAFLRGLVSDHNAEARAPWQRLRERIVDELPMAVLAAERDAGHVQVALAHVADRERPLGQAAGLHAAEAERSRDHELARGRFARDGDRAGARGIVAEDGNRGRFRAEARRLEANGNVDRVARP